MKKHTHVHRHFQVALLDQCLCELLGFLRTNRIYLLLCAFPFLLGYLELGASHLLVLLASRRFRTTAGLLLLLTSGELREELAAAGNERTTER